MFCIKRLVIPTHRTNSVVSYNNFVGFIVSKSFRIEFDFWIIFIFDCRSYLACGLEQLKRKATQKPSY